ncbi:MAG: IreB family regulatory phosphoprotein [Lachnospiraceae bacterium]|nr:IreB family regulatory phosphoprotein [Lachnospiraceae bacterium]
MGNNNTQFFRVVKEKDYDVASILKEVYEALEEKGYNPLNQIVGYIMSGDPTYITSHNGARSLIMKVERDEIIELLFENYINTVLKKNV